MGHIPVMLDHVVEHMAMQDGDVVVDGTFGGGGYTRALLSAANVNVFAIDRDPAAVDRAKSVTDAFGERFSLLRGRFGDMARLLSEAGVTSVDAIVLDLGVSSFQLDEADRGFSFMRDGPLDMRMGDTGPSAADLVNSADESVLADIVFHLGEDRDARRIAKAICAARSAEPFTTTLQLAERIEESVGGRRGRKTHPATKAFQAFRMFVNEELDELARALEAAEALLGEGGRLVVVTFHSLEDRMVKNFLSDRTGKVSGGSRFQPEVVTTSPAPTFERMRKISAPDTAEVSANRRARSSRLRSAVRTSAPSWGEPVETGVPLPALGEVVR